MGSVHQIRPSAGTPDEQLIQVALSLSDAEIQDDIDKYEEDALRYQRASIRNMHLAQVLRDHLEARRG